MTSYCWLELKIGFDQSEGCKNNEFLEPEYIYMLKRTPFMAAIDSNGSLIHCNLSTIDLSFAITAWLKSVAYKHITGTTIFHRNGYVYKLIYILY